MFYPVYIMKYYSTMKKKETLPFATTWMELEVLNAKSDREIKILYDLTYRVLKISKFIQRTDSWFSEKGHGQEKGKMSKGGQNVQTSIYKICNWECSI